MAQESEGDDVSCETPPPPIRTLRRSGFGYRITTSGSRSFWDLQACARHPAVAVRALLREPSRLPPRSPVARISRELRFPGAPESCGFPPLSPEPRSPGSSLKFVFRLPGAAGCPAPPEIRRVPCSAGYPMPPEPRSRLPKNPGCPAFLSAVRSFRSAGYPTLLPPRPRVPFRSGFPKLPGPRSRASCFSSFPEAHNARCEFL